MMDTQARQDRMVEAILTSTTCGEGCWYAREQVCRCSCGGKNHGCLLDGSTERPVRTSKIGGILYELAAVGIYWELYKESQRRLKELPPKDTSRSGYKFYWGATETGSPIRLKAATKAQKAAWPELKDPTAKYLLWRSV